MSVIAEDYAVITDSFGTNSHYCLAVLHFIESLVLGIIGPFHRDVR
jgi:hypothetical protein